MVHVLTVGFNNVILPLRYGADRANNIDPDQTPQNTACDLGLHCLPFNCHSFKHITI